MLHQLKLLFGIVLLISLNSQALASEVILSEGDLIALGQTIQRDADEAENCEGVSANLVSCDHQCLFSSRGKWEKKCTGFNSYTGEIVWENGIDCRPDGPYTCWDCRSSGAGFSASYAYLKNGSYVDTPFRALCGLGQDHPDCRIKTPLEICQERIAKDSSCETIIPRPGS